MKSQLTPTCSECPNRDVSATYFYHFNLHSSNLLQFTYCNKKIYTMFSTFSKRFSVSAWPAVPGSTTCSKAQTRHFHSFSLFSLKFRITRVKTLSFKALLKSFVPRPILWKCGWAARLFLNQHRHCYYKLVYIRAVARCLVSSAGNSLQWVF